MRQRSRSHRSFERARKPLLDGRLCRRSRTDAVERKGHSPSRRTVDGRCPTRRARRNDRGAEPARSVCALAASAGARRLVIVHGAGELSKAHAIGSRLREPAMHHHVALGEVDDVARLWRFLTGEALGFVACGGGAYCAAHIGVYRAFREAGIGIRSSSAAPPAVPRWEPHLRRTCDPLDIDAARASYVHRGPGAVAIHAAAIRPARSHAFRRAPRKGIREHPHRRSLETLLRRIRRPLQLRDRGPSQRTTCGVPFAQAPRYRACCRRTTPTMAACSSTVPSSPTCRSRRCTA